MFSKKTLKYTGTKCKRYRYVTGIWAMYLSTAGNNGLFIHSFIIYDPLSCNTGSRGVGSGACLSWPWEAGCTLDQSPDHHRAVVGYIYSDSNYSCLVYFRFQRKWPTSYRDNKYGPHTSLDHTMGTNLWFCPWVLTLSEHQQWWLPQNDFYHPCRRNPE